MRWWSNIIPYWMKLIICSSDLEFQKYSQIKWKFMKWKFLQYTQTNLHDCIFQNFSCIVGLNSLTKIYWKELFGSLPSKKYNYIQCSCVFKDLTNIDLFLTSREVEESLLRRETAPCLAWCYDNKSKLRKNKVLILLPLQIWEI